MPLHKLRMWLLDDLVTCDRLHPYSNPKASNSDKSQLLAAQVNDLRLWAVFALACFGGSS
ncbi:MAG: hypothetical protein KDB00_10940 [Planctomycetales bacterium]|nr:hypothetical protein [Planctomycetales bacterium]MCA9218939.1 hypothetical protein [Planctomycetales bacterium]